jgi:hypothetical protein
VDLEKCMQGRRLYRKDGSKPMVTVGCSVVRRAKHPRNRHLDALSLRGSRRGRKKMKKAERKLEVKKRAARTAMRGHHDTSDAVIECSSSTQGTTS